MALAAAPAPAAAVVVCWQSAATPTPEGPGALLTRTAALHPGLLQLRIAAAIRRDDEKENSKFPEVPAFPSTRLAAVALQLATGEQKDSVVRVGPQQLQV